MPLPLMHLKVLLPFGVFAEKTGVSRIVAETHEGSFGLLPHRLDCVAALAPGILIYETEAEGEVYVAVDEGVLVKTGPDVLVSVRRALGGTDLGQMRDAVEREFADPGRAGAERARWSWRSWRAGFYVASRAFNMTDRAEPEPLDGRADVRRAGRREGGAQARGAASCDAGRLVRPRHDGADRLVGGRCRRCSAPRLGSGWTPAIPARMPGRWRCWWPGW